VVVTPVGGRAVGINSVGAAVAIAEVGAVQQLPTEGLSAHAF
jgi:hypothetical protein